MIKIAIIGYGNLGYHLANVFSQNHQVSIFSKNPGEEHVNQLEYFQPYSFDFAILTVSDDAIKELANSIKSSDSIILHTSGTRPLSDLENHKKRGVLYPLQTFSKSKKVDFKKIQLLVEGTRETEEMILKLAKSVSQKVRIMNSLDRSKVHLAAVFACNFSNHMFHNAENILKDIGLDFQDIRSLVEETVEKAMEINPSHAQTGPAIRNDVSTLAKHQELIENDLLRELYKIISKSIQTRQ
ncbi:MAG: DUF2520 domain-containing protein [Bacteroidota bacterium]